MNNQGTLERIANGVLCYNCGWNVKASMEMQRVPADSPPHMAPCLALTPCKAKARSCCLLQALLGVRGIYGNLGRTLQNVRLSAARSAKKKCQSVDVNVCVTNHLSMV